jgi:hypothetical protein
MKEYITAYLSSDMQHATDWHGTIIGSAKIKSSWLNANSAISSRMYQVECRIDGKLYTGRSLGAMMLWRGRIKAN